MWMRLGIIVCMSLAACAVVAQDDLVSERAAPADESLSDEAGVADPTVASGADATVSDESSISAVEAAERSPADGSTRETGAPAEMVNRDVVQMAEGEFSDATIVAAIRANPIRFDISAGALLALKEAGVSEPVIEAMLAAEAERRRAEASTPAAPSEQAAAADSAAAHAEAPAEALAEALAEADDIPPEAAVTEAQQEILARMSPEDLARLLEQVAAQPASPAVSDEAEPDRDVRRARAWVADGEDRFSLTASMAEVAITDTRRGGRLRSLQGVAGKALAFVNPFAGELGGLFRSDDPTVTAVWALPGASASRVLGEDTVFEIEFHNIPGVNPNDYRPAIVQLVPTPDNYRLVGAAETKASELGSVPSEAIVEESVTAQVTEVSRGRYRVALSAPVRAGEYALVLRPVEQPRRWLGRNPEPSLGDLIGSGSAEVLYMVWDFTIE